MRFISAFVLIGLLGLITLTSCDPYQPTLTPDYTIRVMRTPDGMVAIPPRCPDHINFSADPYDNQPMPQFGCADARNLALLAERPQDIVDPRPLGPTRGVTMVGTIRRYDNNQTRGFLYFEPEPDYSIDATTSPSAASPLTGDVTGSSSSSSSGSSSSSSSSSSSGASTSSGP